MKPDSETCSEAPNSQNLPPLLDHNRNKCPGTEKRLNFYRQKLPVLADTAYRFGLDKLDWKLRHCCKDAVILRHRDTEQFIFATMNCSHRLCPVCHYYHALDIRRRLRKVWNSAKLFVTLTWPTVGDRWLDIHIDRGRTALRRLTQSKGRGKWLPFHEGYFWRLEVTPGEGFHPHLHVLTDAEYIDQEKLSWRWAQCCEVPQAFTWVSPMDEKDVYEVAKYLSKDLSYFEPSRWYFLDDGLKNVRTYGSGGSLRLPKKEKKGYHKVGFASDFINPHKHDEEIEEYIYETELFEKLADGFVRNRLRRRFGFEAEEDEKVPMSKEKRRGLQWKTIENEMRKEIEEMEESKEGYSKIKIPEMPFLDGFDNE